MIKERWIKETTPIPNIYDEEMAQLHSVDYMDTNPDHHDVISEMSTSYRSHKTTDHPYWYTTWGQLDTDLSTQTVLIRRRWQLI
jgi:hypothetical protein